MNRIAIAIHGGAGNDFPFLQKHKSEFEKSLADTVREVYKMLSKGRSALDAVEKAVCLMEDNYLFNAGRGSALNADGKVEMDAAIMNGVDLDAGAVAIVKRVK